MFTIRPPDQKHSAPPAASSMSAAAAKEEERLSALLKFLYQPLDEEIQKKVNAEEKLIVEAIRKKNAAKPLSAEDMEEAISQEKQRRVEFYKLEQNSKRFFIKEFAKNIFKNEYAVIAEKIKNKYLDRPLNPEQLQERVYEEIQRRIDAHLSRLDRNHNLKNSLLNLLKLLSPVPEQPEEDHRRRSLRYAICRELFLLVLLAWRVYKSPLPVSLAQTCVTDPLQNPDSKSDRDEPDQDLADTIRMMEMANALDVKKHITELAKNKIQRYKAEEATMGPAPSKEALAEHKKVLQELNDIVEGKVEFAGYGLHQPSLLQIITSCETNRVIEEIPRRVLYDCDCIQCCPESKKSSQSYDLGLMTELIYNLKLVNELPNKTASDDKVIYLTAKKIGDRKDEIEDHLQITYSVRDRQGKLQSGTIELKDGGVTLLDLPNRLTEVLFKKTLLNDIAKRGYQLADEMKSADLNKAKSRQIYLTSTGNYAVRDHNGKVQTGALGFNLENLPNRLQDKALKERILAATSKNGHTKKDEVHDARRNQGKCYTFRDDHYLAPENKGKEYPKHTFASDIYACAITVAEIISCVSFATLSEDELEKVLTYNNGKGFKDGDLKDASKELKQINELFFKGCHQDLLETILACWNDVKKRPKEHDLAGGEAAHIVTDIHIVAVKAVEDIAGVSFKKLNPGELKDVLSGAVTGYSELELKNASEALNKINDLFFKAANPKFKELVLRCWKFEPRKLQINELQHILAKCCNTDPAKQPSVESLAPYNVFDITVGIAEQMSGVQFNTLTSDELKAVLSGALDKYSPAELNKASDNLKRIHQRFFKATLEDLPYAGSYTYFKHDKLDMDKLKETMFKCLLPDPAMRPNINDFTKCRVDATERQIRDLGRFTQLRKAAEKELGVFTKAHAASIKALEYVSGVSFASLSQEHIVAVLKGTPDGLKDMINDLEKTANMLNAVNVENLAVNIAKLEQVEWGKKAEEIEKVLAAAGIVGISEIKNFIYRMDNLADKEKVKEKVLNVKQLASQDLQKLQRIYHAIYHDASHILRRALLNCWHWHAEAQKRPKIQDVAGYFDPKILLNFHPCVLAARHAWSSARSNIHFDMSGDNVYLTREQLSAWGVPDIDDDRYIDEKYLKVVVKLGEKLPKINSNPGAGDKENFRAELIIMDAKDNVVKIIPAMVKQYFPAATKEYHAERDMSALYMLKGKKLVKQSLTPYGFDDKKQWVIKPLVDSTLDQVFVDQRNKPKYMQDLLGDVGRAWIAFDFVRYVYYAHEEMDDLVGRGTARIIPRAPRPDGCYLKIGWQKKLKELKGADLPEDLDEMDSLVLFGKLEGSRAVSADPRSGESGDPLCQPPEVKGMNYDPNSGKGYTTEASVYRCGLFNYEQACEVTWNEGTKQDQCRIVRHRLKPAAAGVLSDSFTGKWMAAGGAGIPALVYELTQLGAWQEDPERRPTLKQLYEIIKWRFEDTLIAAGKRPPRKDFKIKISEHESYADLVMEHCADWISPTPPPAPKAGKCVCPPPAHYRP